MKVLQTWLELKVGMKASPQKENDDNQVMPYQSKSDSLIEGRSEK